MFKGWENCVKLINLLEDVVLHCLEKRIIIKLLYELDLY